MHQGGEIALVWRDPEDGAAWYKGFVDVMRGGQEETGDG